MYEGEKNLRSILEEVLDINTYSDLPIVYYRTWDDRMFLSNNDASHRLAAAYHKNKRKGENISFEAIVRREEINKKAAKRIIRLSKCIFIDRLPYKGIISKLKNTGYKNLLPIHKERNLSSICKLWLPLSDKRTYQLTKNIEKHTSHMQYYNATKYLKKYI